MSGNSKELRREIAALEMRLWCIRRGMHALLLRHQALRTATQRYVDEWIQDLPKGWSLDELLQSLQLEREIPERSICIDPDSRSQHLEDLELWLIELGLLPDLKSLREDRDTFREAFVQVRTALMLLMGPDDESSLAARLEMNRKAGLSEHGLEILDQNSKLLLSLKPLAQKAHAELGTSPDTVSAFPEDPACPTPA